MPIRYFSKRYKFGEASNNSEETLYAYAEPKNPRNADEEVPFAEMGAYHVPAQETSNFGHGIGAPHNLTNTELGIIDQTGQSHSYLREKDAYYRALDAGSTIRTKKNIVAEIQKNLREPTSPFSDAEHVKYIERLKGQLKYHREDMRSSGIEYAKGISELKKDTPTELFTHTPAKTTVTSAFAHPSMRHTIPTMGAFFLQKYGELTASDSLSSHSSRFVRKALQKGLPVQTHEDNPDALQTNGMEFDNFKTDTMPDWGKRPANADEPWDTRELPEQEIAGVKTYMKELLFPKKQSPVNTEQFKQQNTQPRLPGMSEGPMGSWY